MAPKDMLRGLVAALVKNPDDIRIEEREEEDLLELVLYVNPKDRGRVLGAGGETVTYIRTVLSAAGGKLGKKVKLKIPD